MYSSASLNQLKLRALKFRVENPPTICLSDLAPFQPHGVAYLDILKVRRKLGLSASLTL